MHRKQPKAPPAQERMIESYRHWIRDARGLARTTEVDRVRQAKELLAFLDTRRRTLASATPLD